MKRREPHGAPRDANCWQRLAAAGSGWQRVAREIDGELQGML
jgi:hypothetical protein